MNVLMVAAENGALPGFKVGGVADVLQNLPPALAAQGATVSVVVPSYGLVSDLPGATLERILEVTFLGRSVQVGLWQTTGQKPRPGVRQFILDHPLFSVCGKGAIYCNDGVDRPFASDASKFALFSAAVAEGCAGGAFGALDVVHLHDWHTALFLVLARYNPRLKSLTRVRTVFTIHNLALQGVRPLAGDPSSLEHWFPDLEYEPDVVCDPRWPHCINAMASAIRLADAVSTVSPGYAREILLPNDLDNSARHGGEGLEADLGTVDARNALKGILNGCEYPLTAPAETTWPDVVTLMRAENLRLAGARSELHSAHFVAANRLADLGKKRPRTILVTVGRITEQKLGLLRAPTSGAPTVLDDVLDALDGTGIYLILGSGDADLEQFLVSVSARRPELVFLRGYTDALPGPLYALGDLFLMPSTYEPCGISQMIAMHAGQPCLVHAVGGLKDTVRDGIDGFSFNGDTTTQLADAFQKRLSEALSMRTKDPKRWEKLRATAMQARFLWSGSAEKYLHQLYVRNSES